MDFIYNLALQDRSRADQFIQQIKELDPETLDHILTSSSLAEELDEVTRINDPRLYHINNVTDADFIRERNKARRDHVSWSLFVDNFIGENE